MAEFIAVFLVIIVQLCTYFVCAVASQNAKYDLNTLDTTLISLQKQQRIPKILHHIFLGTSDFPPLSKSKADSWHECVTSCVLKSPDFVHVRWNNSMVMALLEKHYPWAVSLYTSYPYGVQRADSARYFILHRYGGMYLDMDVGCKWNLSDIYFLLDARDASVALPDAKPLGISNWLIISVPRDPFLLYLISKLESSQHSYGLPYLTVLFSTGPLFVGWSRDDYITNKNGGAEESSFLVLNRVQTQHELFFHTKGQSWHSLDGVIIWKCYVYRRYIFYCIVFVAFLIIYCRFIRRYKRKLPSRKSSADKEWLLKNGNFEKDVAPA